MNLSPEQKQFLEAESIPEAISSMSKIVKNKFGISNMHIVNFL